VSLCRRCHNVIELLISVAEEAVGTHPLQAPFYDKLWWFFRDRGVSLEHAYLIWLERGGPARDGLGLVGKKLRRARRTLRRYLRSFRELVRRYAPVGFESAALAI